MDEAYALLDTNVLLPAPLFSTLLYIAFFDLFNPLWSDHIIEELHRHLADWRGKEQAAKRIAQMEKVFVAANIDRQGINYHDIIDEMPNHEKDRHVLAAAVAGEANYLVTENVRHFQLQGTAYVDIITVLTADQFLCRLFDASSLNQWNMLSALHRQVAEMRSLHTLEPLLAQLEQQSRCVGFVKRIDGVRANLAYLPVDIATAIYAGERISL